MPNNQKIKQYIKQKNGITLIALAITIVILLILAGISLNMTIGQNGIIKKAGEAAMSTKNDSENTDIALNNMSDEIDEALKKPIEPGDWIEYHAGTWTQDEINSLGSLYSGTENPTEDHPFTFGGFGVGSSRDNSIPIWDTNPKYSSGWRILNIDSETNTINIVPAGVTEAYYHSQWYDGGDDFAGFISEYILRGQKNSHDTTDLTDKYTKRNWDMYIDNNVATSAHCMTNLEAYNITNSYQATNNDLENTGVWYFTANAYYTGTYATALWDVLGSTGGIWGLNNSCAGIRPVVTLKTNIKLTNGDGTQENPYKIIVKN